MGKVMSSLMGNYARDGNLAVAAGSSVKHHDPAVTVSSLMERYMLTEATCNREITEEFIASISQSFCDDWRKLPGILRVRMNVVDEMENKYRNDEWMCKIGFFRYWKRSIGPDATYEVLIGALLKIDCMGDAHSVCKLLQESAPVCTQQPVSTPSPKGESSEQFPNLPTKNLNGTEIGDLRARLIEDCRKLDRDFTSLVHKTLEFLERNHIPVGELRDLVKTSRYLKSLLDLFEEGLEVRRLFVDKLDAYWSFFDYDLIELFVQHFGDAALKDLMNKYLTAFNQYCRRKLHEVPNIKTESGRKGYILHVKIPQKFHATTVNDIKEVQIQFQKLFGQKLYMEGTRDSCVLLVFVSFIKILSLTGNQVHQLRDMGVLNVSTKYCVLYDHGNDKTIEKLRSSTVMVLEPSAVIRGRIQQCESKQNWTEAELYLTPAALCYKIEGIGVVCTIGLQLLKELQVKQPNKIHQNSCEIAVHLFDQPNWLPILITAYDDIAANFNAAFEWRSVVFYQKSLSGQGSQQHPMVHPQYFKDDTSTGSADPDSAYASPQFYVDPESYSDDDSLSQEQKREKRHKKSASFHGNLPSCFTEEPLGQKKGKGHKKLASF